MKKFAFVAAATLALATAAPAIAEQNTTDNPFVSTQGSLVLLGGAGAATGILIATVLTAFVAVASSGDS